ncbi:MAG: hypothetical protein GXP27_11245, partial [Planctomycetes bacterium]|nr:hypothetical protein [Planctomycetota bacterium]
RAVVSADLNNDSVPDLAIADEFDNTVSVLLGNGDGTFAPRVVYPLQGGPVNLTADDFDGDGDMDIAVTLGGKNAVAVLPNDGTGTFGTAVQTAVGDSPFGLTSADLDGDGDLDLITTNLTSEDVSVLLNNGNGLFAPARAYAAGARPTAVTAADLDYDGDLDLAIGNSTSLNVLLLRNQGDGSFTPAETFGMADYPTSLPADIEAGDLNGDGIVDLAVANSQLGTVVILGNRLVPGAHVVTISPDQTEDALADFGSKAIVAAIGGRVWEDVNANGVRDPSEPGVAGVAVSLFAPGADGQVGGGDDQQLGSSQTTAADGAYRFSDVPPGFYYLRFDSVPAGSVWTAQDQGTDDSVDSDVDPATGIIGPFQFSATEDDLTRDGGLRQSGGSGGASISGVKWLDQNGDGVRDEGEPGLAGWTIYADLNGNGRRDDGEPSAVTRADDPVTPENEAGTYGLAGLAAGTYTVAEVLRPGWEQTYPAADRTHVVTVEAGQA